MDAPPPRRLRPGKGCHDLVFVMFSLREQSRSPPVTIVFQRRTPRGSSRGPGLRGMRALCLSQDQPNPSTGLFPEVGVNIPPDFGGEGVGHRDRVDRPIA